ERFVEGMMTHGLARTVDSLSEAVNWAGDPAEFAAAATTALGAGADTVPQLDEHLIPVLLGQLGNVGIAPVPTPGEVTLATLEALDTFGVAASRESGVELQRPRAAAPRARSRCHCVAHRHAGALPGLALRSRSLRACQPRRATGTTGG